MSSESFALRTMVRSELDLALDWAAAEGWNPGLHDAACFHAADPDGFLIGLLHDEPVAVISVVRYGIGLGFLGLYIVKPSCRGHGYGLRLWNAGMARLAGRCVGLDGVLAQQANYRRSGFVLAHRNIRCEGRAGGGFGADAALVPLTQVTFAALSAYDEALFGASRAAFLKAWIDAPDHAALGILRNGALAGYGVVRRCRVGSKIGPFFADDADLAERLFLALRSKATPGAPLFLDLPEVNAAALDLARRHHMTPAFETARMYAGPAPELPMDRVYGVTTFELG